MLYQKKKKKKKKKKNCDQMCSCDQLRKLVAQVRPVGRMSLEPYIYIYFFFFHVKNLIKYITIIIKHRK